MGTEAEIDIEVSGIRRPPPSVLHKGRASVGRHDVVGLNVVGKGDGLVRASTGTGVTEVVGRVGGEEPGAVDHVPFRHDVVERFVPVLEAPLELMVAHQEVAFHS